MNKIKPNQILMNWIVSFCKKQKAKHDELTRKKISALLEQAELFFTDVYILEMQKINAIDFHPALYKTGKIKSYWAAYQAYEIVLSVILDNRVDDCYTKLVEHLRTQEEAV